MRAWNLLIVGVIVAGSLALTPADPQSATEGDTETTTSTARCVLITGANRGLGLEFAKQYADAGWDVIGTARKPDEAAELRATGATILQLDVTDDDAVKRMAKQLDSRAIDLLIHNAGIGSRAPSLSDIDIEQTARVLDVNLLGPMRVTTALLPNLRAGSGKTIVSISSALGSLERNTSGRYYGYRESKAGLNMFMRSLAAELQPDGFTCIAMSPGWVRTDMGGAGASLSPEQSITGMRAVIADLTPEKTGRFFNHDGEELPW